MAKYNIVNCSSKKSYTKNNWRSCY